MSRFLGFNGEERYKLPDLVRQALQGTRALASLLTASRPHREGGST
jgi:hypothetical protein